MEYQKLVFKLSRISLRCLLLAAVLSGCQFKKGQTINPHQRDQRINSLTNGGSAQELGGEVSQSSLPLDLSFPKDQAEAFYRLYKNEIFSTDISYNPDKQRSSAAAVLVKNYLDSIAVLKSQNKWNDAETSSIFKFFSESCSRENKTCSKLRFFSQDNRFSEILIESALKLSNWKDKYYYLQVAWTMSAAGRLNPSLAQAWFSSWVPLVHSFIHQDSLKKNSFKWFEMSDELAQFLDISATLLTSLTESQRVKYFSPKISTVQKWVLSSGSSTALGNQLFKLLEQMVLTLASNRVIADPGTSGGSTGSQATSTHAQVLELLQKNYSESFKLLNIQLADTTKLSVEQKTIRKMIERSIQGASDIELRSLWMQSKYDFKFFLDSSEEFLRTEIAFQALKTHEVMGKAFKALEAQNVSGENLFRRMANEIGVAESERWATVHARIQSVKRLFQLLVSLRMTNSGTRLQDMEYRGEKLFANEESLIRLQATGPASIMLTYIAAVKKFEQTIQGRGFEITFTGDVILDFIFNAQMPTMYLFTSGERAEVRLDLYEILNSFEFLLKLKVLNSYKVSSKEFYKEFFERTLAKDTAVVNEAMNEFNTMLGTPQYQNYSSNCSALSANKPVRLTGNPDLGNESSADIRANSELALFAPPLQINYSSVYPEFEVYRFMSRNSNTKYTIDQITESFRLKILSKLRVLKFFSSIGFGAADGSADFVRNQITAKTKWMSEQLNRMTQFHRSIRSCSQKMFELSLSRAQDLTEDMKFLLGDVQTLLTIMSDSQYNSKVPMEQQNTRIKSFIAQHPRFSKVKWNGAGAVMAQNWLNSRPAVASLLSKVSGLERYWLKFPFFVKRGALVNFETRVLDLVLIANLVGEHPYAITIRNQNVQNEFALPVDVNQYLAIKASNAATLSMRDVKEVIKLEPLPSLNAKPDPLVAYQKLNLIFDWFSGFRDYSKFVADLNKTLAGLLKAKSSLAFTLSSSEAERKIQLDNLNQSVKQILAQENASAQKDYALLNLSDWQKQYLSTLKAGRGFELLNFDASRRGQEVAYNSAASPILSLNFVDIRYLGLMDHLFYMSVAKRLGNGTLTRQYDEAMDCIYMECGGANDPDSANRAKIKTDELVESKDFFADAKNAIPTYRLIQALSQSDAEKARQNAFINVFAQPIQAEIHLANQIFQFATTAQSSSPLKPIQFMYDESARNTPYLSNSFGPRYLYDIKIFNRQTDGLFFPAELKNVPLWRSTLQ